MPRDRYGRWYPDYQAGVLFGQPEMWGVGPANEEDEENPTLRSFGPYGPPMGPRPYQRGERLARRQRQGAQSGAAQAAPRPLGTYPRTAAPTKRDYRYPYYGFGYTGYGQFGAGYGGQAERVMYSTVGPYAGVPPKGYTRSDERIWEEVNEELTRDAWLDPSDIEVNVQNGAVTLTGTVDSRLARRLAAEDARRVFGVRDVRNELRVLAEGSPGEGGEEQSRG